jgi:hypothetical protein
MIRALLLLLFIGMTPCDAGDRSKQCFSQKPKKCCRIPCPTPTLNTFGQPYVIWVDGHTTTPLASQDGTLGKPFSTIQAGINKLETFPSTSFDDLAHGWTIMIADGIYDEDLTINCDNRIILLIALGNVAIGDPETMSLRTITVEFTPSNTATNKLPALLSLGTVNSNEIGFTLIGSLDVSNTGSGNSAIYANICAPVQTGTFSVSGSGPLTINVFSSIINTPITVSYTSTVDLNLVSSTFGDFIMGNSTTFLQLAEDCTFNKLVTVDDYVKISGCTFNICSGLKVTTSTASPTSPGQNLSYIAQTVFAPSTTLSSTCNSFIFQLDYFTNFWVFYNAGNPTNKTVLQ